MPHADARSDDPDDIFALARALGIVHEDDAPTWESHALCSEVDPALFFPEKGRSSFGAREVCSRCTVREECLETALREGRRWGVWGGLGQEERIPLHQKYDEEHGITRQQGHQGWAA